MLARRSAAFQHAGMNCPYGIFDEVDPKRIRGGSGCGAEEAP